LLRGGGGRNLASAAGGENFWKFEDRDEGHQDAAEMV